MFFSERGGGGGDRQGGRSKDLDGVKRQRRSYEKKFKFKAEAETATETESKAQLERKKKKTKKTGEKVANPLKRDKVLTTLLHLCDNLSRARC